MLYDFVFGHAAFNLPLFLGVATLFVLGLLLPARIVQRRHGYSAFVLLLPFVPFFGPMLVLWGFAFSIPNDERVAAK